VRPIVEHFAEASAILSASKQQLLRVRGIGEETGESIANWGIVDLAAELKCVTDFGCEVHSSDEHYPAMLRENYESAGVLYSKPISRRKIKNGVAYWCSRMRRNYGIEVARKLAYQLAYVGVTVVSGGARGLTRRRIKARCQAKAERFVSWARNQISCSHRRTGNSSNALRPTGAIVSQYLQSQGGQAVLCDFETGLRGGHDSRDGGGGGESDQRRVDHGEFCDGIWPADFCRAGADRFTAQQRVP